MAIKLTLLPNGPINLTSEGEDPLVLRSATGDDIPLPNPAFLCRCGVSKKKPFCDGAHGKAGYTDANTCRNDDLKTFQAEGITVHFNRSICSGAAACVHSLPSVFESSGGDWIHPERAPVAEVIAAVRNCPSGALTFTLDGRTVVNEETEVSLRVVTNGPYEIKGPVDLAAPKWSKNASQSNFALCRCGKSANAPFCDYTHGEQGWDDSV